MSLSSAAPPGRALPVSAPTPFLDPLLGSSGAILPEALDTPNVQGSSTSMGKQQQAPVHGYPPDPSEPANDPKLIASVSESFDHSQQHIPLSFLFLPEYSISNLLDIDSDSSNQASMGNPEPSIKVRKVFFIFKMLKL